ncbi:MAG TPA: PEP-CTERM sorting domain-containing protein [Bryobacteraceae bacterium]|jgi:hypothetical protein
MRKWILAAAGLLLTLPAGASTYFAGFEDTVGTQHGDNDYNDLVFSISGQNLTLVSGGTWYTKPALGTNNGAPFWNHDSYDGSKLNVGYCIYGGGNCGTGAGLDPSASYLASSNGKSMGNVYFSADGTVSGEVDAKFSRDYDRLGWYSVSDPHSIHWFSNADSAGDVFSFTPGGYFGLVASSDNGSWLGQNFYSQDCYGTQDDDSHFAFFADPPETFRAEAPEPGQAGLLAIGLIGLGLVLKKKSRKAAA